MKKNLLQWAQRRNFSKYKLLGLHSMLKNMCSDIVIVRGRERDYLDDACQIVRSLLEDWEERNEASKKQFIKGRS